MSIHRARRLVLERLGSAAIAMVSLHLSLSIVPAWADGADADGHAVLLVGAHELRKLPGGDDAVHVVLKAAADGHLPASVHAIGYQRAASEAIAAIVDGPAQEVLCWGSRASGKTQLAAGALLALAELQERQDYAAPLRALWLHGSLVDASAETGRSAEGPTKGARGSWREDRRVAVATVGGREMVLADFAATQDVTTRERLRSAAHIVLAEEVVGTLDEAGGIDERSFEVALTSARRLPGRRRVAILTT